MKDEPNKEGLKEYFDSLPDDQFTDSFDSFFVGDAAEGLMKKGKRGPHKFQGMFNEDTVVEMEDDLSNFQGDLQICNNEEALLIFSRVKGAIFEMFGFTEFKSRSFSFPVKEEDLIVTEDDYHLIAYLVTINLDIQSMGSVASLVAFGEMGVLAVQFKDGCGCPICQAVDGSIFEVAKALEALCEGNQLVHKGCRCGWTPIFDRKRDYGFTIDDRLWGKRMWYNVPLELKDDMRSLNIEGSLIFTDMQKAIEENEFDTSEGFPVAFRADGGILYVHKGYIDGLGPVDFLKGLEEDTSAVDDSEREVFLYKGRKVYLDKGFYRDAETGEVL